MTRILAEENYQLIISVMLISGSTEYQDHQGPQTVMYEQAAHPLWRRVRHLKKIPWVRSQGQAGICTPWESARISKLIFAGLKSDAHKLAACLHTSLLKQLVQRTLY